MLKHFLKPALFGLPLAVSCGREPVKDPVQIEERTQTEAELKLQAELAQEILDEALARGLIDKFQLKDHLEKGVIPVFDSTRRKYLAVDKLYAKGVGKVEHAFKKLEYLETLDFKALAEKIRKLFFQEGVTTERDYHLDVELGMIPVLRNGVVIHLKEERMLTEWIVSTPHAFPRTSRPSFLLLNQ